MIKKILLEELENLKLVLSAGHKDFVEGDYNCFLRLAEAVEKHLEDIELKLTKLEAANTIDQLIEEGDL
jgi:hypothetical protein